MDDTTIDSTMDDLEAFVEDLAGPLPEESNITAEVVEEEPDGTNEVEPTAESEPEPEASTAGEEEDTPEWQKQISELEARQKETRSNFDRERQARLELERQLEDLRAAPKADDTPRVDPLDKYEELFDEDPKKAIAELTASIKADHEAELKRLREEIASEKQNAYARELERQENAARKSHEDYDDMVTDYLAPLMENDPTVTQQWRDAGGTAEAAYELGKKLKERETFLKDPDALKNRIREELLAELKANGNASVIGDTLAGDNSHGIKSKAKHVTVDTEDILESIGISY